MLGARARMFGDWVMLTAAMSSLIPLRFWMSLARSGAPTPQPQAPPRISAATSANRAIVMNQLRSDGGHICYRKCNDNQRGRDQQHIADHAIFAALAGLGRGLDDALIHDRSLDLCGLPPDAGNGASPGFDPPPIRPRLDGRRRPAHIPPVTRTTHRAGDRRISLPGPARARVVLI